MGPTALVSIVALALGVAASDDGGVIETFSISSILGMTQVTEEDGVTVMFNHLANEVVVNGDEVVDPAEAPYIVRLLLCGTDGLCYTCGGTWISQVDILTAAHCLPSTPATLYFYRNDIVGLENQRHSSVSGSTTSYTVHPDWDGRTGNGYDIAIMHTTNTVAVVPIKLAEQAQFDALVQNVNALYAYGYGQTTAGGEVSDYLLRSKPLGWLDCGIMANVGYYVEGDGKTYKFPSTAPGFFCFEATDGSDMCKGDSGGPLVMNGTQYGINSFVYGSCGKYPSVDTSTAYFVDWITDNSGYDPDAEFFTANNDPSEGPCDVAGCSHYCSEQGNDAVCTCPMNLTIDIHNTTNCVSIDTNLEWSDAVIRDDGTIRPFSDSNQCFYHKLNGYTTDEANGVYELIYIGDCVVHNRYRWYYTEQKQLMSQNRWTSTPHCITIPDADTLNKKQQLYLGPCDDNRVDQKWIIEGGHIKLEHQPETCVRWNLLSLTRLWSLPCDDMAFATMVQA